MNPVMCLEAEVNKESVMAVFFAVERAYYMIWKETNDQIKYDGNRRQNI